ncbi:MAG: Gx transporter family protein [Ruminococcus sp.]|nr:Gx transporter family protein [Ruminococcus sp.]
MAIKKLALAAVLAGLALIIFVVEAQLPPFWIPGIKLGLANVVTLVAILFGGYLVGAGVVIIRVVLGAVFCGTFISFLFSIVGAVSAYLIMCLLINRFSKKQIWVVSVFGAIFHSLGQIVVAFFIVENANVLGLLPFLIIASIIAGTFTGLCAQRLWFSPLQKYKF